MPPLTIVSASRLNEQEFFVKSALGRSLATTYSRFQLNLKIFFNNTKSLSARYNEAIRAGDADEFLLFVHDDILVIDFFWADKIAWGLQKFHIVGLAGNRRRVPRQPGWLFVDDKFTVDDSSNLSGMIGHGRQFPCRLDFFGPVWQECKLLDGVFIAATKSVLRQQQIEFDERFDFHFYDLDFCRQAEAKNLVMGTIPLSIIHESAGAFGTPPWKAGYEKYLQKWKE